MAETDPRLVRLVATHFNDLKGFMKVPFAAVLAGAGWAWSSTGSVRATFLGGFAALAVGFIAYVFVVGDRYSQLGRVATSARRSVVPGLMGGASVMVMNLQTDFHIPGPSAVCLAYGFYLFWTAIDGWPWRWYYIAAAASAVYVAFGRTAVAHPTAFAWMAPRLWVFSFVFLMCCIADHFLLLRVMRPTDDAPEEAAS